MTGYVPERLLGDTSGRGSSGWLHLTWTVAFRPGRLVAVARNAADRVLARDQVATAGPPDRLALTTDRTRLRSDGRSLAYLTVHVLDAHGVPVPSADDRIHVEVTGAGTLAGADNGKQDDAEGYKSPTHDAFNGLMLAIVQSGPHPGAVHVRVTSPGLRGAAMTLHAGRAATRGAHLGRSIQLGRSPAAPTADASFSGGVFSGYASDFGTSDTVPAAMLDHNPTTYWSNRYTKVATQTLPDVTNARPGDWVSLSWAPRRTVSSIQPSSRSPP